MPTVSLGSRFLQHGQVAHTVYLSPQVDVQLQQGFSGILDTDINTLKTVLGRVDLLLSTLIFLVTSVTNGAMVFTSLQAVVQRNA